MDKTNFYEQTKRLYEQGYGEEIVKTLIGFSSSDIGFRLGGTPQEHEASAFLAEQLKEAGLSNVKMEEIPVDAFELKGAEVMIDGAPGRDGKTIPARIFTVSQFAGFRGTEGTITAPAVYVGKGFRQDYDKVSTDADFFKDKIVILDGDFDRVWVGWQSAQATAKGALAAIYTTCPEKNTGNYLTYAPDMLIGADGENSFEDIPAVFIARQDGDALKAKIKEEPNTPVSINSRVDIRLAEEGGRGYNVTAEIPGRNKEKVILLGAHQDAHLKAGVDDTGSVATVMTIAKAMCLSGYQPDATIRFIFISSEEYGKINTVYDWQHGAVEAVKAHPEWAEETALMLNYEVMPEKGGTTLFRGVPEVMSLVESCAGHMKGDTYPAAVETLEMLISIVDEWTFCARGIPCISMTSMREDYLGRYHTNYDREEHIDYDGMRRIANASFDLICAFDENLIGFSPERRVADFEAWYSRPETSSSENGVLMGMSKEEFKKVDIDETITAEIERALQSWKTAVEAYNDRKSQIADIEEANKKLILYNKHVLSSCIAASVGQNTIYPYMQTLSDTTALKEAVDELRKDAPDRANVLAAFDKICLDLFGWVPLTQYINWFDRETCDNMLELYQPMEGTWGYYGKLSPLVNLYKEYEEVRDAKNPDYKAICAVMEGHYEKLHEELEKRLKDTAAYIGRAAVLMDEIR